VTYKLGTIDDQVSLDNLSFNDGHSYCRAREIQFTAIEPLDGQPTPADSLVSFDAGTFSLQGLDSSEYGRYKVKFSVGLEEYEGLVPQENSFEVKVVPDCLTSTVSANGAIVFTRAATGTTQTFPNVASLFSYDQDELVSDYCGDLEFELVNPPSYLSLDSVTTDLTFSPTATDSAGTFTHAVKARLVDYPSRELDLEFEVEIVACPLERFYASEPFDAATSTARTDLTKDIRYVVLTGYPEEHAISFTDYEPSLSAECEALYEKTCYTVGTHDFVK